MWTSPASLAMGRSRCVLCRKGAEVMTVRVCSDDSDDGRHWLRERGKTSRVFGTYYSQVLEGEIGQMSGYDGFYVLDRMKKEGKLPS